MALELRKRVFEFLQSHPDERFKAREIAEWLCTTYPDEANAKIQNSSFLKDSSALRNQLVAEIGANRPSWQEKYPNLRTTETRPRLYFWSDKSEGEEVAEAEGQKLTAEKPATKATSDKAAGPGEYDLYPLLIEYLKLEHKVVAVRIDERRSTNSFGSGGNRWLYPDVVGIESLASGLHEEVREAVKASNERKLRLWSFEVKVLLNRSNIRETYYQAVSNSSWANFGYLVAAQIDGAETLKELRILYAMHGIGVIHLDRENPAESEILIPASDRSEIQWPMCSRLAHENPDFRAFVKKVRHFFQTGDLS